MTHNTLDLEIDRELLENTFDEPESRYILLYMYMIRFSVFQNLEDDDINNGFDQLYDLDTIYKKNLRILLPENVIEELFNFGLITNIKNYQIYETKDDDFEIRLNDGVYTDADHVMYSEEALLSIIKPEYSDITLKKIKDSLKKLRSVMCQTSSAMHPLVHKYNEDYVLDDELYNIIFFLGNPFLALRLEKLVVNLKERAKKIEADVDKFLKIFYPESLKTTFLTKIGKAIDKSKNGDLLEYIIAKSKKLPEKFSPNFNSKYYEDWRRLFNQLLQFKHTFKTIFAEIENVEKFYSGKNQKMSYLRFIEEVTNNEDEISSKIRDALLKTRNKLKEINDKIDNFNEKDIKILNLDLEREVIENQEEETD